MSTKESHLAILVPALAPYTVTIEQNGDRWHTFLAFVTSPDGSRTAEMKVNRYLLMNLPVLKNLARSALEPVEPLPDSDGDE